MISIQPSVGGRAGEVFEGKGHEQVADHRPTWPSAFIRLMRAEYFTTFSARPAAQAFIARERLLDVGQIV